VDETGNFRDDRDDTRGGVSIENLLSSPTDSVVHSPTDEGLPRELQIGMALDSLPRRLPLSDILIADEEEEEEEEEHHQRQCIWPLNNRQDAELLRHFVDKLARWVSISPSPPPPTPGIETGYMYSLICTILPTTSQPQCR
jgi:hypothetical protein